MIVAAPMLPTSGAQRSPCWMLRHHHSLISTYLQDAGAAACVCDEMPVVAVLNHQCGQKRIIVIPPVVRHTHAGGTRQARGPLRKLVWVHPA